MTSSSEGEFPRWFGDYLLVKELGRGGMGQVCVARQIGLQGQGVERLCVIKTLRPHLTADREYVARFVDEARVVVQLAHRNICPVFDVGTVAGTYYLAMDLVPGRDLTAVWNAAKGSGVDVDVGLALAIEVVDALDAAHRMVDPISDKPLNLVHRDVSPHNVLLSFDGEVKLIDFGLAKSTLKVERTEPGVVLGKLAYMSPEHARGDAVDRRADLFAVGVVLYELLTGERWWEGFTLDQVWRSVGHGGHKPAKLAALPVAVREVIEKSTAPRATDRYQTGAEMRQALVKTQIGRGVVAGAAELRGWMERAFPGASALDRRERGALLQVVPPPRHDLAAESSVRIASASGSGPAAPAPTPAAPPPASAVFKIKDPDDLPTVPDGALRVGQVPQSSTSSLPEAPVADSGPLATVVVPRPKKAEPASSPPEPAPPPTSSAASSSKRGLVAAAVVGAVAIAVAVVALGSEAGVVVVDAGAPVVVAPVVVDAGVTVVAVVPVVVDAGVVVVVDAGVVAVAAADAGVVDPKKKNPPTTTTTPPKKKEPLPLPAELPRLLNKKVELLLERCARLSCSAPLGKRYAGFAGLAADDAARLVKDVDACLAQCR